jgi:hypothetical protein
MPCIDGYLFAMSVITVDLFQMTEPRVGYRLESMEGFYTVHFSSNGNSFQVRV